MRLLAHHASFSLLVACFAGCASVDFDEPKPVSRALDPSTGSYLAQRVADVTPTDAGERSGFYIMGDGVDALATRFALADSAEHTVDAQYYLFYNDLVGGALVREMLKIADRGVRVRLLADDFLTIGMDQPLLTINRHPNIEVRLFNPFANRGFRALDLLTNFGRVNHRMHNKSFIVDNQVAIIGGRNIADEYFGADPVKRFGDLDTLVVGPVVQEASAMFDEYWNHSLALPVDAVAELEGDPDRVLDELRAKLDSDANPFHGSVYERVLEARESEYLHSGNIELVWADYELFFDSPDKATDEGVEDDETLVGQVADYFHNAESEILIVSPYFVLQPKSVENYIEARAEGLDITIITNSLSANNHAAVHSGYIKSRKKLLRAGCRIYEIRADANVRGSEYTNREGSITTLHTKAFIIDRRYVFIGSFNFDPRSVLINTESGVIIDAPEEAERLLGRVETHKDTAAYEVYLNEDEQLRWRTVIDGEEAIFSTEPETSWRERMSVRLMGFLPILKQL